MGSQLLKRKWFAKFGNAKVKALHMFYLTKQDHPLGYFEATFLLRECNLLILDACVSRLSIAKYTKRAARMHSRPAKSRST